MRLSADTYKQIIAALKSDSHRDKDKRREPRVGISGEAEYVTVNEQGKRVAGTVRVRDVSPTGIGLMFPKEMAVGQRFVVQLYSPTGEPIWLVCLTAHCRKVDLAVFSVGAKIQQLLKADEIQKVEAQSQATAAASSRPAISSSIKHAETSDIERISKAIIG